MPTRTINLKLQISKTEEGRKVRAALWTTDNEEVVGQFMLAQVGQF
jgi:hypothetical protein